MAAAELRAALLAGACMLGSTGMSAPGHGAPLVAAPLPPARPTFPGDSARGDTKPSQEMAPPPAAPTVAVGVPDATCMAWFAALPAHRVRKTPANDTATAPKKSGVGAGLSQDTCTVVDPVVIEALSVRTPDGATEIAFVPPPTCQLRLRQDLRGVARHQPATAGAGKLRTESDRVARRRRSRMPTAQPAGEHTGQRALHREGAGHFRVSGGRGEGGTRVRGDAVGDGSVPIPVGRPVFRLRGLQHDARPGFRCGARQSSAYRYSGAPDRVDAVLPVEAQQSRHAGAVDISSTPPKDSACRSHGVNVKRIPGDGSSCERTVRQGARPSQKRICCRRANSSSAAARSLPSTRSCSSSQKGGRSVRNRDNVTRSVLFMLSSFAICASTDPPPSNATTGLRFRFIQEL